MGEKNRENIDINENYAKTLGRQQIYTHKHTGAER